MLIWVLGYNVVLTVESQTKFRKKMGLKFLLCLIPNSYLVSVTSADFQQTSWRCILEESTLFNHLFDSEEPTPSDELDTDKK
jgi:hypothetical protein